MGLSRFFRIANICMLTFLLSFSQAANPTKSKKIGRFQNVVNQVVLLHFVLNKKYCKLNVFFTHWNNNFDNVPSIKVVNLVPKLDNLWQSTVDCQLSETFAPLLKWSIWVPKRFLGNHDELSLSQCGMVAFYEIWGASILLINFFELLFRTTAILDKIDLV